MLNDHDLKKVPPFSTLHINPTEKNTFPRWDLSNFLFFLKFKDEGGLEKKSNRIELIMMKVTARKSIMGERHFPSVPFSPKMKEIGKMTINH